MIDLENTKIAFQNKNNRDLYRAHFLFNTFSRPLVVKTGKLLTDISLKTGVPIKWIVKPTVYKQFCGGETIEECEPIVRNIGKYSVTSILEYSAEGKENPEDMDAALNETIRTIENAARNEYIPFAVFKPTAFAKNSVLEKASSKEQLTRDEQKELDHFRERIERICKTGYQNDVAVLIDAEEVCHQYIIDQVARDMMKSYNQNKACIFNTLQMYRWDRIDFLKNELKIAEKGGYHFGAKFVRGAYMERERARARKLGYLSPIQPDKTSTDQDYDEALKIAIENIDHSAIFNATHNENSCLYLTQLMENHQVNGNDERIYFCQLYGMSDHISYNLADAGYNVAKYLPYGPVHNVMPYLIRRAEENTAVAGQTSRELELIKKELRRRKSIKSTKDGN